MKYSLRSLMIAVGLGPPLLAGLYFLATQAFLWPGLFVVVWFLVFGVIGILAQRKAKLGIKRSLARCSFCSVAYPEAGELAEGPGEVFICYQCASASKHLIETECRRRGIEPRPPASQAPAPTLSNP